MAKEKVWEVISENSGRTERMPVCGGWLYRTVVWEDRAPDGRGIPIALGVAMVFVPLP